MLTRISLQRLIVLGRVHEGEHNQSVAMKQLSEYGSMLEFYVDAKTNTFFRLNLVLTNERYLTPNIPISRVDFPGNVSLGPDSIIISFSSGVEYILKNNKESWEESDFGQFGSGWGDTKIVSLESRTKKTRSKEGFTVNTSVEYKLE